MTLKEAARAVLAESGEPLSVREIARRIVERDLATSRSRDPAGSLQGIIGVDIKRNGERSTFVRVARGLVGLRASGQAGASGGGAPAPPPATGAQAGDGGPDAEGKDDGSVKMAWMPPYGRTRALLGVLDGVRWSDISRLWRALNGLRGTTKERFDWSDPDAWIEQRLTGDARALAARIWRGTRKKVEPHRIYNDWLLARHHGLVEERQGAVRLTPRGRAFVEEPEGGAVAREIDEAEGLLQVLAIVGDHAGARFGALMPPWQAYVSRRSGFRSDNTVRGALRSRLVNLVERGLVEHGGSSYSITDAGIAHLQAAGGEARSDDVGQQIRALVRKQEQAVREGIADVLADLDPVAFEHLVRRLLEEMGYADVEVTSPTGDGGVDVVANIELGITSVREVVQAKRHRSTIQRSVLDALRGSLHRFRAVRGTIITTSRFSRGTREAAFEPGAAPITLIDGEKLVDLLIEHEIGARRRSVELLELDAEAFADIAASEEEGEA